MPYPNFIIAGATRSGTTSLYKYLNLHPQIHMAQGKEMHYFNHDDRYGHEAEWYQSQFDASGRKINGESTPLYFEKGVLNDGKRQYLSPDDSALKRIKATVPDIKLIVTLRNPVERYISIYDKNRLQGKTNFKQNIIEQIQYESSLADDEFSVIYKNRYALHLGHLDELFSRDQVLVIILEEWEKSVDKTMREIFRFLGVDMQFTDSRFGKKHNTKQFYVLKHFFNFFKSVRSKKETNMAKDLLKDRFDKDITFVENYLGRRIDAWHR